MTDLELASAVLQLVVDEGGERVTWALHDALVCQGQMLREHGGAPHRVEARRLTWLSHLVGDAYKTATGEKTK